MSPRDETAPPGPGPASDELAVLLHVALSRLQANEDDPQAFLDWMRQHAFQLAPGALPPVPEAQQAVAAYWIGVALWNATPLAGNHYRPRPLPPPGRNQPCPCGSGRKFKHCCLGVVSGLELPTELIWTAMLETRSDRHWLDEAARGALPTEGKLALAYYFHDADKMRSLIRLLEPEFSQAGARADARLAPAIDLLCDAYDATYRTDRKKRELLRGLAKHPARAVRAEANQRLAAWLEDQGDLDGAWGALQAALRADPNNPGVALLEITLLCARGEPERARQRADFWYRRLLPFADDIPEALEFLAESRSDPCAAFERYGEDATDPDVKRLVEWVGAVRSRAVPRYAWQPIAADPSDEAMRHAHALEPGSAIRRVEKAWQAVKPLDKPFSIQWLPDGSDFAWEEADDWLDLLARRPEAFDSLDILDDLVNLILSHPDLHLPWLGENGLEPLVERGVAILRSAEEGAPSEATLPWLLEENRPALRLLSRAIAFSGDEAGGSPESVALMRWYLRRNPADNHGWRALLVNELLKAGEDAEALAVIERYPDDMHPEIVYGKALALYRTGAKGRALTALAEARDRLPLVLDFLARDRVRRPAIRDDGRYTVGGKDQAWLYREAMRETWVATAGMLDMLRGLRSKRR